MRKIGFFGGTFNPVHNAHIKICESCIEQLGLDFVIMMTGGNMPHKDNDKILDAKIRHIMLKLATEDNDKLIPCDFEVNKKSYCYSSETLAFLKRIYPDDEIYFILGADSYNAFDKWHEPQEILKHCKLAVYARDNQAVDLEKYNAVKIVGEDINISSTELRNKVIDLESAVPEKVFEFINKYKLYQDNGDEKEYLKRILTPSRFQHSLGVADMAKKLGIQYGLDADRLYKAGLLHDCAKSIPYEESLEMSKELGAELDAFEMNTPALIHAKLGAELAKCWFGLKEGEITSAIRYHTVGKLEMSDFERIIFVADMCEEGREFPGVDEIREMAFCNLNKACLMCVNATIRFNTEKKASIHPMAFALKKEFEENYRQM